LALEVQRGGIPGQPKACVLFSISISSGIFRQIGLINILTN